MLLPNFSRHKICGKQRKRSFAGDGAGKPRGNAMAEVLRRWAFPEQTRVFAHARGVSIALRTVHLGAFGILLGGHVFAVDPESLLPYLSLTVLSGLGLMALEIYAVGLYWLCLGKGIMVLVKLAMLLLIPVFWEVRVVLLLLVVGIASVGSHMPARYRNYSLRQHRITRLVRLLPFVQNVTAAHTSHLQTSRPGPGTRCDAGAYDDSVGDAPVQRSSDPQL